MRTLTFGVPNPKQYLLFKDKHRYIAYGGARGGGKSWSFQKKSEMLAMRYPGIKILIVRKTYRELLNNYIADMQSDLYGIAVYNKGEKIFYFPNGSTITFGYCANEGDLDQYQGAQYDVVFIDEATQLQEDWLKKINASVRGVNSFPKRTYYGLNPGGPSHGYFKRLFIDRRFEGKEKPERYSFIQALLTDNKILMETQPEYREDLENLPPKLRDAWLYGNWDVFEGQFFEDFRIEPDERAAKEAGFDLSRAELLKQRRFVHVIDPFDLNQGEKQGWSILRSYDFGYGKPYSCAWWAIDYDGVMYRILEDYGCTGTPNEGTKMTPDQQFERIARIENEHPWLRGRIIDGVADPAIWDGSRGESIYDTACRHQIYFRKGINDRIPGWMQVHYRFQFDENGFPRMYVFRNCKDFIRTIPLMQYDNNRVEDLDSDLEDHIADETRYACMDRPVAPLRAVKPAEYTAFVDPLNLVER
ncbi:MAG: phage terminase large subunit [Lachnospiraceae bacterium]|nr:phage terminase large subunit [Lachnospiraceae bacterium]